MLKKIMAATLAAAVVMLSGCAQAQYNAIQHYDFTNMELVQLEEPEEGAQMCVIDTDLGTIKAVLYPEYAPKTVENFVKNAKDGLYDNQSIYVIATNYYFLAGGHETEDGGYVGRISEEELLENEYSVNLWPFRGALMSCSEKGGYSDSRYFIVNNDIENNTEESVQQLIDQANSSTREDKDQMIKLFRNFLSVGGVFGYGGYYTVFGQTIEGLDVVKKITDIVTGVEDENDKRPAQDIKIKSITITEYDGSGSEMVQLAAPEEDKTADTGAVETSAPETTSAP